MGADAGRWNAVAPQPSATHIPYAHHCRRTGTLHRPLLQLQARPAAVLQLAGQVGGRAAAAGTAVQLADERVGLPTAATHRGVTHMSHDYQVSLTPLGAPCRAGGNALPGNLRRACRLTSWVMGATQH